MNKSKINYSDSNPISYTLPSTWNSKLKSINNISTQTDSDIYSQIEIETQTTRFNDIYQIEVTKKISGQSLLDILSNYISKYDRNEVNDFIINGLVTIDYEICKNPNIIIELDSFIESIIISNNRYTQTTNVNDNIKDDNVFITNKTINLIESQLIFNNQSNIFNNLSNYLLTNQINNNNESSFEIALKYILSIDFEKYNIIYPDWSNAKYIKGKVMNYITTRTNERLYEIEYDDNTRLNNIKEEYINILNYNINNKSNKNYINKLNVGVRLYVKYTFNSNTVKYIPGYVVKLTKNLLDIEIDNNVILSGISYDDIIIRLEVGQVVEALYPSKITLQCTGIKFNLSGNSIACSYGSNNITGWCNIPGAICIWNLYNNKLFDINKPDYILDHSISLMCLSYHPIRPSIISAGSFNGELIIWDLTSTEQSPYAISPMTEYSHKEPISDINWIYDNNINDYLLVTIGSDGKILLWRLDNKLLHPIKGFLLSQGKISRRQYPLAHGGRCMSISIGLSDSNNSNTRSKWIVIGQDGGAIVRIQASRLLEGSLLTKDSFKSLPNIEDIYQPIKRSSDIFSHEPHIGSVNSLHCSPFNRNLFLSGGSDGSIKLFHMLEKSPLYIWEPAPPLGTTGASSTFAPITCVQFSPIKPTVFACSSSDGFIFIYDLSQSLIGPVVTLESIYPNESIDIKTNKNSNRIKRVGISSLSFNHKHRDVLSGCDLLGFIHVWKLNFSLYNKNHNDKLIFDRIATINTTS